jgi:RNA polymerase sigma-70 factor (ECF subfamily)
MGSTEPTEDIDITALLRRISNGDSAAEASLIPQIYQDLRRMAAAHLRRERRDHTLQPTALVHEVYLRLLGSTGIEWSSRAHFFRLAATVMRRILVDHARNRKAGKRGGDHVRISLDQFFGATEQVTDLVIDVDAALTRLAVIDQRQAKVVEMRFFAGLSEEEIGGILNLSSRTVKREWAMARAWLRGELAPRAESEASSTGNAID